MESDKEKIVKILGSDKTISIDNPIIEKTKNINTADILETSAIKQQKHMNGFIVFLFISMTVIAIYLIIKSKVGSKAQKNRVPKYNRT